jgi:arylsulfatase A-like enzyme
VQAVDEMVADLVQLLEETGQLDNTYIFFTSDNGFHMGEHMLPSGKMLPYEEDIHVPLYVRGPGIPPGTTVTQMTANIDIAPTIAELAGAKPAKFVDGRSFASFLFPSTQQPVDWRQALLIETGDLDRESTVIAYRGVRTGQFIYVEYESGELEFYDLVADPYEMDNLASSLDAETLATLHNWLEGLKTCEADECRTLEMTVPDIKY